MRKKGKKKSRSSSINSDPVTENPPSETRRNPTPLTAATSQQNPVRRESGDPELEPAPNRAAKARRDASSAAGAAHCREEQHCHRRAG
ncbi:hypothetical protein ZWY2020_052987 [Hordeum vulgare]|nr:hypothetical protein ZWY2020_052987 [Hordeum vulgare]